jgi:tetratricopeptide (TPR) repeat protein
MLLAGILASTPLLLAAAPNAANAANASDAPGDDDTSAKQFAAAIDRFNALDPQSADTLNTRLSYANFLVRLDSGDCRAHLDEAQSQLDVAKDNRALVLVVPSGLARMADVEYQLHSARASCGAGAAVRDQELRAALEAAQRAVALYRDAFDAVSMVTMQFNVGVAYHELGDVAAASAALRATLDLDREYGFADDAAENYRLLLQWNDEDAGPEQVAARMQDFPERSATLSFGWFASDATLTLQSDISQIAGTDFVHFQSSRTAQRHVRKLLGSWVVSHQLSDPHVEIGELPASEQLAPAFANSLARMLVTFHDFRLDRKGDFDQGKGDFSFEHRARADVKTLSRELGSLESHSNGHSTQLPRRIGAALRDALLPNSIEAQTAENYNLEAGTWIGATLEQGVWYDMTAALFLPLAPQAFLIHKIQFTYSRPVPCNPGSSEVSCIEIVVRATPDPSILKATLDTLARRANLARGQVPQLWSVTTMRLVTDPATLWTYSRETRWHAYWWNGVSGPDQSLIESEKSVVTMSVPTPP